METKKADPFLVGVSLVCLEQSSDIAPRGKGTFLERLNVHAIFPYTVILSLLRVVVFFDPESTYFGEVLPSDLPRTSP